MDMSSLHRAAPSGRGGGGSSGRTTQVKNKAPANVQITAEQLLREAQEFKEDLVAPPKQQITDPAELREYQGRKRQEFEDGIRRNRHNMGLWMRYAAWEAQMEDLARSRSVYERAIDVDYRNQSMWLKYAEMEMRHRQVNHARNVWDRAVGLLPRIDQFWYKYAYMEEMLGEVEKARGIFERWMAFHPNEQAWLSFIKLELRHNFIERARSDTQTNHIKAKQERREKALCVMVVMRRVSFPIFSLSLPLLCVCVCRALYERFTLDFLTLDSYLKYAKFETRYGTIALARRVYERAQEELTEEERSDESFYISFAYFEERNKEYDRARCIYQFALDHLPKHRAKVLYDKYVAFEKSFGDKEGIELVILSQKRFQYEEEIARAAASDAGAVYNYDIWFDYLRLEQDRLESIQASVNPAVNTPTIVSSQCARIRDLYERAVANVPPILTEKKHWKRYIYIWLYWLVFEEQTMSDAGRCREIANKLLGAQDALIPHANFTFAKLWLHVAHFELRQGELDAARRKLGEALGRCQHLPATKLKIFRGYLALELQLGALDRVRTLYEKLVEYSPELATSWIDFAAFESRLGETARARALYELAVSQSALDQPERVWKSYIEFEVSIGALDAVRALYARLLDKTKHVKVWVAAAQFEAGQKELVRAREVFARAEDFFKSSQATLADAERAAAGPSGAGAPPSAPLLALKEERLLLLQSWRDFERTYAGPTEVAAVSAKLPQQLKKRKPILAIGAADDEPPVGYEEYYDYIFPEESAKTAASGLQLMERAKMWSQHARMRAHKHVGGSEFKRRVALYRPTHFLLLLLSCSLRLFSERQQEMKQAAEQARLEAAAAEREAAERDAREQADGESDAPVDEQMSLEGKSGDASAVDDDAQPGAAPMEQ